MEKFRTSATNVTLHLFNQAILEAQHLRQEEKDWSQCFTLWGDQSQKGGNQCQKGKDDKYPCVKWGLNFDGNGHFTKSFSDKIGDSKDIKKNIEKGGNKFRLSVPLVTTAKDPLVTILPY